MSIIKNYLIIGLAITMAGHLNGSLFQNTLSLTEFGSIPNTCVTLQPSSSLGIPSTSLRTNDFQNLQLSYSTYATGRSITRMGAFLISQSATPNPVNPVAFPGGPGVAFPDSIFSGTQNPAQSVIVNPFSRILIFTSAETNTFNLTGDPTLSTTRQAMTLSYVNPNQNSQSIVDYNVIGNAFHDVKYNGMTPVIYGPGSNLIEVKVYSAQHPNGKTFDVPTPPLNFQLPPGNKFALKFQSSGGDHQTRLIYVQPPTQTTGPLPEITFTANFNQSSNILLSATAPFTGFLRSAIIQVQDVPYFPVPSQKPTEVPDWSTGLGIQTIAPSPAALFMLWPLEFASKARKKIETNFNCNNNTFLPYCPWLSILTPVVSDGDDLPQAKDYLDELVAKIPPPMGEPFPFDGGTNQFLTYLYLYTANLYANDISSYQKTFLAYPNYGIDANHQSVEETYDTYRHVIPLNAELNVGSGQYSWSYQVLNTNGTSQTEALVIFPGYKSLDSSKNSKALKGFVVNDPIKGKLLGTATVGRSAFFKEAPLPKFLQTGFFPDDIWDRLPQGANLKQAQNYFITVLNNQLLPGNINSLLNPASADGYGNGKTLYMASSTILYGTKLLEKLGTSKADIITLTKPTVDAIKNVIEGWLFGIQQTARTAPGFPSANTPNFFVGDSTVDGVCYSIRGMLAGNNAQQAGEDFGNATYNDHHFAYGYWLGAAAGVIEWDILYGTQPWIAQEFLSGTNMGPYKMKAYVDMLWRDTHNPDPNDPDLPFNRHGNPWEGHSTANGLIFAPYAQGRNQESLAEDFNCWLGTLFYARGILNTANAYPGSFTPQDIAGFNELVQFCETNLAMTANSGNLYYNTAHWPFAKSGFNFNAVAANVYDALVDSATFFQPGSPPCNTCGP